MKMLVLVLFAGCSSTDDPCEVRGSRPFTDGEAAALVSDGGRITSTSPECSLGLCVRDATVCPGPPAAPAAGYCAATCAPDAGCAPGHACADGLCLRLGSRRP